MDYYCIRCCVTTYWCRIAMVVDDFGFMRWNHASFGRPGTGRRHDRNRRRIVVLPRVVMTVMIVLLLLLVLMVMVLLMATVAATAVREALRGMAHSTRVLVLLRAHSAARSHAIGGAIVLRRRFPRALQWHVRTTTAAGGHRRLVVIAAGRNTWMMEVPVVDSWSTMVTTLRRWWRLVLLLLLLLLRRNIRRWNTCQMGQMWWRRRNLMRSGAGRWQRVTHVGMHLLLLRLRRLWLRGMSVNHPAPGKHSTSFRNHFCFRLGGISSCTITNHCWSSALFCFQCGSVNYSL